MVLAKDEVIVKEWKYATDKVGTFGKPSEHNLIVTNKRVVSETVGVRKHVVEQAPISSVKTVSASHDTPSKGPAYCLIVFGILLAVVIVGIFMIIAGVQRLKAGTFEVTLTSSTANHEVMHVGAVKLFKTWFKHKAATMKIKVNNDVCHEIVDVIGALIIENQ